MKRTLTGKDVEDYSWCDANIESISWENEGRDIVLKWLRHNKNIGTLEATWAHATVLNIVSGENLSGGTLLTWDAEFTPALNNG